MPISFNFPNAFSQAPQPDETPILEKPFFEKNTDAYKNDLSERNGGLQTRRPEDRAQIESISQGIKAGVISDAEAERWAHRNPGAATEFKAAIQLREANRRAQQIIQSGFTAPQSPFEASGPPTRQGIGPIATGTPGGFEAQRVTRGLLSEGLFTPGVQQQVAQASQAVPAPAKPLTTSNVINTLNPDTGKSEIVTVDQAVAEGREKAPTHTIQETTENLLNKHIPPNQLKDYRDNKNQTPKIGTKYGELEAGGFALTEQAERKQINAAIAAENLIGNLVKAAHKNNIFAGDGWFSRVQKTFGNAFDQMAQSNTPLSVFNANRRASLSLIIRALGEVGTLNVQDIQRIDAAVPKADGYGLFRGNLVDNQKVAREKFRQLASFLKDMRDSLRKRGQGPTPPGVVEDLIAQIEAEDNVGNILEQPSDPDVWTPADEQRLRELEAKIGSQ